MSTAIYSVITGTGRYIPSQRVPNSDFLSNVFYDNAGNEIEKENKVIIEKFKSITTITERRYAKDEYFASDLAYLASLEALKSANIDKEDLDYIILAHNFGDISAENNRCDMVPSLAARVKHKLGIENPECVAYDIIFGCPGWLQGLIQADYYIKSGDAKKILIIGTETLSRVCDPHDRDSMIYADGAGATILEAKESATPIGILAHKTRSDSFEYAHMLNMGKSYNAENKEDLFIKMNGRKLYQYALSTVPQAIKSCLEKSNTPIEEIKNVLIHQANGKMDDAILERLYRLYDIKKMPEKIMPMTIDWLGNSSVATVPTLLDLILKGEMEGHNLKENDTVVFASVGAGMNINAVVYRW